MSSFPGRMDEYGFISLDRFDGENLSSTHFFLSHCHQDHMVGLGDTQFLARLQTRKATLYCHEITAKLLSWDKRYKQLEPYMESLEMDLPTTIESEGHNVVVTLLSAGHCPGSVMFLFEGSEGTVLYTGDFRLTREEVEAMNHLAGGYNKPKHLKSLYFDSTFCVPEALNIPSRHQSLKAMIDLVTEWLVEPEHKVFLHCAAKYGHEFLMVNLAQHFGAKIHVTGHKFDVYNSIRSIASAVTDDQTVRIHACSFWESDDTFAVLHSKNKKMKGRRAAISTCSSCRYWDPNVLVIKPSMMWFSQMLTINKVAYQDGDKVFRLQYSSHSSLKEIKDMITYLQPEKLYPNVIPKGSNYQQVIDRVKDCLDVVSSCSPDSQSPETVCPPKRQCTGITIRSRDSFFDKLDDSPVKPKQRERSESLSEIVYEDSQLSLWQCPSFDSSGSTTSNNSQTLEEITQLNDENSESPYVRGQILKRCKTPELSNCAETLPFEELKEQVQEDDDTLILDNVATNIQKPKASQKQNLAEADTETLDLTYSSSPEVLILNDLPSNETNLYNKKK